MGRVVAPKLRRIGVVVAGLSITMALPAHAVVIGTPVYNEETGSYFALGKLPRGQGQHNWAAIIRSIQPKHYNGRRGRLAVLKSKSVQNFILDNFDLPLQTWIGLRYWCKYSKLQWVDGTVLKNKDFQPWNRPWYRSKKVTCSTQNIEYMPVYLLRSSKTRVNWQASGPKKGFYFYLVEYPDQVKPEPAGDTPSTE